MRRAEDPLKLSQSLLPSRTKGQSDDRIAPAGGASNDASRLSRGEGRSWDWRL